MKDQTEEQGKLEWSAPTLTELNVTETAGGNGASDGMGGGSVGGGNRSGS